MVENSSSSSSSSLSSSSSCSQSSTSTARRGEKKLGESIECNGEYCTSCTASVVADCIAVCCCPCAIANFVILTFVKVPWMMGRRCLGLVKKKRRMVEKKKKKRSKVEGVVERSDGGGNMGKVLEGVVMEEEGKKMNGCEEGEESAKENNNMNNVSASYEADRVWLEMYQLGHLGFGRVSFSGVPDKKD